LQNRPSLGNAPPANKAFPGNAGMRQFRPNGVETGAKWLRIGFELGSFFGKKR
jgi:hypothetical protein